MASFMSKFITILYGSETGVAEDVAYSLHDLLKARVGPSVGADVAVHSMETYDVTQLPSEQAVVFVVSTTGDGEAPQAMRALWAFMLQRSLSSNSLQGVQTAVFGLGDSGYEKYNACARKLSARLRQLGSTPLLALGLGDDQAALGYLGALGPWTQELLSALGAPTDDAGGTEGSVQLMPPLQEEQYSVTVVPSPVDECKVQTPAVQKAVDEYTTLFNDSLVHRTHLVNTNEKSLASSHSVGVTPGAGCGVGAFQSPDRTKCSLPHAIVARVVRNSRMTAVQWPQEVRDLALDFSCSLDWTRKLAAKDNRKPRWPLFKAGDVAVVHPKNPASVVERMLRLIPNAGSSSADGGCYSVESCLQADSFLSIKRNRNSGGGGGGSSARSEPQRRSRIGDFSCTALQLLTWHLDLCGMPRKSFFAGIAHFASKEDEREKLVELASAEGASLYYEYCQRERRTYVEVLEEFTSVHVPLHRLLELIPLLQPRHYSVASSGFNAENMAHVELCVAVTTATTPYGRKRKGLCSSYLAATVPGEEVFLWLRSGTFANPGLDVPVILIGPGTGLAPMRAMQQERRFFMRALARNTGLDLYPRSNVDPGTLIFYGCRRRKFDFLYSNEWEELEQEPGIAPRADRVPDPGDYYCDKSSPLLDTICVAFSQDGPEGTAKTYVTHKIRKHGALVARLIEIGAHIYVAGSANSMPADVRKAVVDCLVLNAQGGEMPPEEAEKRVRAMEKAGKYAVEAWSA